MTGDERFEIMSENVFGIVKEDENPTNRLLGVIAMALTSLLIVVQEIRDGSK